MNITKDNSPKFFAEFSNCFGDIVSLPKAHDVSVKPEVTLTISPARRVPIALRDKLKSELDRMIELYGTETVSEPTEWLDPLVTVKNPTEIKKAS